MLKYIRQQKKYKSSFSLPLKGLFKVMLKSHTHVGCNVSEIQNQKDEHQAFQDTAKVSFRLSKFFECKKLKFFFSFSLLFFHRL
jgi:hypothetical protein